MDIYEVQFNGNSLHDIPGVDLYNYNFTDLPQRDIKIHKLARRSLSIITSSEYTQKNISIWMDVCSGDKQDTEETITAVKALLQAQNGELKVLQSNIEVTYTATMNEFNIQWNASHAYVEIVFVASTPIATATGVENAVSILANTFSTASQTFSVEGSYLAEPYFTVVVNSVTGGSGGSISIINAKNQQGITVTANFTIGDILTIDSLSYEILLNGAVLDFEGLFPTFSPGLQQIEYSDTFTTRNVDITMEYRPRLV